MDAEMLLGLGWPLTQTQKAHALEQKEKFRGWSSGQRLPNMQAQGSDTTNTNKTQ